ncbi:MAG: hypothetical protein K9H61_08415 [Bacteroidia bacterium]|nr:hypothetical protein [Bacteroidia bacterium]MCF8427129.1 hypothetical protein [Bacteroidia bacterium]MCF8447005.1 hypothetical protein [Bacteroidia bacterium]
MDTTKCISNRDWEAYSRGELGSAQIAVLQAHCASCEICADIKEGIDAMRNPSLLSQKVDSINKEIEEKLNPKKDKIIPIYYWLAAAAVFFAVSLFVLNLDKKVDSVQQDLVSKTIEKLDTSNNVNEVEVPKKELAIQTQAKPKKPVVKVFRPEPILVAATNSRTESDELAPEAKNETRLAAQQETVLALKTKETVLEEDLPISKIETRDIKVEEDISKKILVAKPASVEKKAVKYKSIYPSNFANNQNVQLDNFSNFNSVQNFAIDTLPIAIAREMYSQTIYDSALQLIQPILQNPVSNWYEEALWLKSQILLAQKDLVQTEIVLTQIIALKGKYQILAETQLKALKK